MGEGKRGVSIYEQEEAALRSITIAAQVPTFGEMTDHGHPATYFSNPDGTFMLVCTRISKAVQATSGGDTSIDETASG